MSSLLHLMRCLMKADFARAMRGYASRPAKGECPKWVISGHVGLHETVSALPLKADILGAGDRCPLSAISRLLKLGTASDKRR